MLLAGAFVETFVGITLAASTPAPHKSRIDIRQLTRSPRSYLPPGISIEFVASLACGTKEFTSVLRNVEGFKIKTHTRQSKKIGRNLIHKIGTSDKNRLLAWHPAIWP